MLEKFDLSKYKSLYDLPLDQFNKAGYSLYVLDKKWNYLFINDFVLKNLGEKANGLLGKNMWEAFPELTDHTAFKELRENTENGKDTNLVTYSPITTQRVNITGHPISDCYIFTSSILPKKEEILNELRQHLDKNKAANRTDQA